MTDVMMDLAESVSDARGVFHARAMARERRDGGWEGWLEFLRADADASVRYATPIETHQHDRVTMERWASGLTRVYAEGALARARVPQTAMASSALLVALEEIADVLNRRIPHVKQGGEAQIAADAKELRAAVMLRITLVRNAADNTFDDADQTSDKGIARHATNTTATR
jgi:hypothetical protein